MILAQYKHFESGKAVFAKKLIILGKHAFLYADF